MAIGKLKKQHSPVTDQIQAELLIAGGRKLFLRSLNFLILFGIGRKC
jgi:hypothetical protein